jgi:hypothetical protein
VLRVRLTTHPLAMGLLAVDAVSGARTPYSALFVEYFTYQAAGEPKFVVLPSDERWFDHFLLEAEALWDGASAVDLGSYVKWPAQSEGAGPAGG